MSSSYPSVVIQSLCTSWTKASRGGLKASARNRTPEMLELATSTSLPSGDTFLLHSVLYDEKMDFRQTLQKLEQRERTNPFRYDCLKFSLTENTLDITIEWERSGGMPQRPAFLRRGFSLQAHQWGRVIYNIRLSWEGYWTYEKRVLNIGFFTHFSPTIFLETLPAHTYRDIARLW